MEKIMFKNNYLKFIRAVCAGATLAALTLANSAQAFCGFYVGKADASLFNDASQVIMARHDASTTITMLNDYKGTLTEFAMVVPVPEVLKKEQIKVVDKKIFDRIDAYTAPRLAEYFDPDPCQVRREMMMQRAPMAAAPAPARVEERAKALGVKIEAQYTVGEYDIVILSAKESGGLERWLNLNKYRIPKGASKALQPYIRQGLKFFVAKVNLKEQVRTGSTLLRPLQFTFNSEKFMLPIRLGTVNAQGPQDLVIYMLTKNGRVEATNYRTVKLPANMDLPVYLREEFSPFYKAMFNEQAKREALKVVFTEYFWDMGWCDPCAADPLSTEELKEAGVSWLPEQHLTPGQAAPGVPAPMMRRPMPGGGAQQAMVTRLHVRYSAETFPEDLMFQETKDRQNYQTRYVLRHAWKGDENKCEQAKPYFEQLVQRQEREVQTLSNLTGWDINDIRQKAGLKTGAIIDGLRARVAFWK
jgi:hypothetical protein